MGELEIVTTSDRPDLAEQAAAAFRPIWPEFIFHSSFDRSYLARAGDYFDRFDVLLADDGEVVTGGWGVALRWDAAAASLPQGYDEALLTSVTQHEDSVPPDTLVIMAAAVRSGRQGRGLAGQALTALRGRATAAGLSHGARVSLSHGGLTSVPDWVRDLTAVTHLDLSFNPLAGLPAWLGELTALTYLDLRANELTEVPRQVGGRWGQ